MSFGSNLEKIRKDKKVSQTMLGAQLGLTQQMISSYEKDISSPNIEVLIKIADYFNVSIDSLVGHAAVSSDVNTPKARFLQYFEILNDTDKEKCVTIIQTLLTEKELD